MENNLEILFKNNTMIKAKYDFTKIENGLLQKVFFDIQKNKNGYGKFTIEDMKLLTNDRSKYNSNSIKQMLADIKKNEFTQIKSNGDWVNANVVSGFRYKKDGNFFEVELSKMFLEMVLEYKQGGFTTLNVTKYIELSGSNSQHIYELLRMWTGSSKKKIEYSIKEIREYLCLVNKYKVFSDFKNRVIEAAVKDINKKGLMDIKKVEYIKKGKKIDRIIFHVEDLEPKNYNFNKEQNIQKIDSDGNTPIMGQIEIEDYKVAINSDSELLAAKSKLSVKTIDKLIKDNNIKIVNEAIKILVKTENVKAPLKYLKGIIENLLKDKKTKHNKRKSSNFESRDIKEDESLFGWDE